MIPPSSAAAFNRTDSPSGMPPVAPDSPFARFVSNPSAVKTPAFRTKQTKNEGMAPSQNTTAHRRTIGKQKANESSSTSQEAQSKKFKPAGLTANSSKAQDTTRKLLNPDKQASPATEKKKEGKKDTQAGKTIMKKKDEPSYLTAPNHTGAKPIFMPGMEEEKPTPFFQWRSPFYHPTYAEIAMRPSHRERLAMKKSHRQMEKQAASGTKDKQPNVATKASIRDEDAEDMKRKPPSPAEIRENPSARKQRKHEVAVLEANPWNDHLFANSQA